MPHFDPHAKLAQLCRRHGLPDAAGDHFQLLMERASRARAELARTVVEMVDRRLAAIAAERARERVQRRAEDEACLRAVAPLLHRWNPAPPS